MIPKGLIIGGDYGKIIARQKTDQEIELGELLIAESENDTILLQVYDLIYGSQVSQQNLELISGMQLEENTQVQFNEQALRNYKLMFLKSLLSISDTKTCKTLPTFFAKVRGVTKDDLTFLTTPTNPLYFGKLRSGSKMLDVDIALKGKEVLSHHILVAAATGKGKSNLTKVMLWDLINKPYCGMLILDPHDEYYGRNQLGLKDHPDKDNIVYYTPKNPPVGARTLKINLKTLKPAHFKGVINFSPPQKDVLNLFYRRYKKKWIESIILEEQLAHVSFNEATLAVVKRKLLTTLNLDWNGEQLFCNGIFDLSAGETTIGDIVNALEESKKVIIDTSSFSGAVEILVGGIITESALHRYQYYKTTGILQNKPVISILLEEAPRVLGKDVLEKGSNIFEKIAREGRKFKIGLYAITQLPSLIPKTILANMNTKIILGTEMASERAAIIESAAQDLSNDNRSIASLDKGEAIITSNFARFATPIKAPLFKDFVEQRKQKTLKESTPNSFSGVQLT